MARTAKQKEFDLILKYAGKPAELTKRIKTTDLELIEKYKDQLIWRNIVERKTIDDAFIEKFWDNMKNYIPRIDVHPNMHIDFLKQNRDYINWWTFVSSSSGARFTIDFIKEFEDELKPYFNKIVSLKNLPKETHDYVMMETNDKSAIWNMSCKTNLSMKLIDEYADKLDWSALSSYSKVLSSPKNFKKYEDRIKIYEFTSALSHSYASDIVFKRLQIILNEEFLLKYKDEIDWKTLVHFSNWSFFNDSKKVAVINEQIPLDFFKKHKDKLPEEAIEAYNQYVKNYNDWQNQKDLPAKNRGYGNYWIFDRGRYFEWEI